MIVAKRLLIIFTAVLLVACVSSVPFPSATQNGGSVIMSLGGRNVDGLVDIPRRDQFTVAVTDQFGNTESVTVRVIFPVMPDATSPMAERVSGVGFHLMTVDMVDPVTGLPTTLAAGPSTLTVNNTQGIPGLDGLTLPLDILPGVGSITPISNHYVDDVQIQDDLTPREQLRVMFTNPAGDINSGNALSGISLKLSYPAANVAGVNEAFLPRPISTAVDSNVNFSYRTVDSGTDKTLIVDIVNPYGIAGIAQDRADRAPSEVQMSNFTGIEFSIVLDSRAAGLAVDDISLDQVEFVDLNGNIVSPNVNVSVF